MSELQWGAFKPLLAEAVVEHLRPVQERFKEVMEDPKYLEEVLNNGAEKASKIAERTLENCYDAMGFHRPSKQ